MFRKPKKKPAALRGAASAASGGGGGSLDGAAATAGQKRRRQARRQSSSSSSDDDDNNNNNNEEGTSDLLQQIRQERDDAKAKGGNTKLLNTSSTTTKKKKKSDNNWMHQYKSNDVTRSAQDEATRSAEYHPDESKQSASGEGAVGGGGGDAATSQNAQTAALQKQPRNKFLAGPLRATTFVRTTVRFDYQPDICKDYKETGFCGFGDTCIYLHDRGDTKTGWQMEQEYEENKKRQERKKGKEMEAFMQSMMCGEVTDANDLTTNSGDGKSGGKGADDGIPYACHICRSAFTDPIVTTCNHYFCEKCMLQRVREVGSGCPVCQKDTHGVLNHAQKLVAKKRRLVGRDGTWEEYLERSRGGGDDDGD